MLQATMPIRPRSFIAGAIALVVFGLIGGWYLHKASFVEEKETSFLKVADGGGALPALIYVAYDKAHFLSQGLNIHLSPYTSGKDALASLVDGQADIATVSDTPIARAILEGKKFKIIATIATSGSSLAVITQSKFKTPGSLVGQKIGYVPGTNSEYFLREFLIKHGIQPGQISWVPMRAGQFETALATGQVAAAAVYDPFQTRIRLRFRSRMNVFFEPILYQFPWNVVVSESLLDTPEVIESFLRSLAVAEQFLLANPEEAQAITARHLRLNLAEVKEIWRSMDINVSLEQSLVVSLERQLKMQQEATKAVAAPPNVMGTFYFDAMETVLPARLTVIR